MGSRQAAGRTQVLYDDGRLELLDLGDAQAVRDKKAEAGARVELKGLFSLLNVPHVHQVHLFYRARLLDLDYLAGIESLECRLFSESEIPWDDIAFPTVSRTLQLFFSDYAAHRDGKPFGFHSLDIRKRIHE